MAFKMKGFSGFGNSPMKDKKAKKGSLSWKTALEQLKSGGEIDVWKDAKEKKAAKEQSVKDEHARSNQAPGVGGMRPI